MLARRAGDGAAGMQRFDRDDLAGAGDDRGATRQRGCAGQHGRDERKTHCLLEHIHSLWTWRIQTAIYCWKYIYTYKNIFFN